MQLIPTLSAFRASFLRQHSFPWFQSALFAQRLRWGGVILAALIMLALLTDHVTSAWAPFAVGAMIALVASSFMMEDLVESVQANVVRDAYEAALKQYTLNDLVFATASPEIDLTTRDIVMEYLNSNHRGWSTQYAVVNATR